MNLTFASFFAGVGGLDYGFSQAGFQGVFANEMDKYAVQSYRANHNTPLHEGDIRQLNTQDLPDFDVLIAGFPCQAFSTSGFQKGLDDERGVLFFELVRILAVKKPQAVCLENVKNLLSMQDGAIFRLFMQSLSDLGYHMQHQVLSAHLHGNTPQGRERLFMVGFLNPKMAQRFEFPALVPLTKTVADCLEHEADIAPRYFYDDRYAITALLQKEMTDPQAVYQLVARKRGKNGERYGVRKNAKNLCFTLMASMGTGGHNVPLVCPHGRIRKLTPRECFNLQGFPADFQLLGSHARLYRQAGNSVCVPVVRRLAQNMQHAWLEVE